MIPAQAAARPTLRLRVRWFLQAHPEAWCAALAAAAWGMVIPHAAAHHAHHPGSFGVELRNWCLMVVAMMVPLMLEPLRWVALQSFRHRRHRAVGITLLGFLLPWLALGSGAAWLRTLAWTHHPLLAAGMFGLAALWVLVPARTRALVFCHWRVPLAPSGWRADRDCLRYGSRIGASCVVTCGLLMVACTLAGHSLLAMLGGAFLGVLERYSFRPPRRPVFVGALLLAGWFLLPVLSPPHSSAPAHSAPHPSLPHRSTSHH